MTNTTLVVEGSQSNVSWEYETLVQRLDDLKKDRQELDDNLRASIFEVKQKSAFRGLLLEKKLAALNKVQEEREAQLNEVLSRANLDPVVLTQVKGHVDDILLRKNNETRQYQTEVIRLQTLHEQLHEFTKNKLSEYGLSMTEFGYVPKKPDTRIFSTAAININHNNNNITMNNAAFNQSGPALASENY